MVSSPPWWFWVCVIILSALLVFNSVLQFITENDLIGRTHRNHDQICQLYTQLRVKGVDVEIPNTCHP